MRNYTHTLIWTIIMVMAYGYGSIITPHAHLHHHAHEQEEVHQGACELDLCHVSMYHPGQKGCDHKAHWTNPAEKCFDCHELFTPQSAPDEQPVAAYHENSHAETHFYYSLVYSVHSRSFDSRGPPTIS